MTKHVRDRDAGIHRKKPHLVRSGRSATHPFETEEPPTRSRHRDQGVAHDVDRDLARLRTQHKRATTHRHKRKGK